MVFSRGPTRCAVAPYWLEAISGCSPHTLFPQAVHTHTLSASRTHAHGHVIEFHFRLGLSRHVRGGHPVGPLPFQLSPAAGATHARHRRLDRFGRGGRRGGPRGAGRVPVRVAGRVVRGGLCVCPWKMAGPTGLCPAAAFPAFSLPRATGRSRSESELIPRGGNGFLLLNPRSVGSCLPAPVQSSRLQ